MSDISAATRPRKGRLAARIGIIVAAVAGLIAIPSAAFAEGNFSSYLSQVQPTFTSRTWTDNNLDSTQTTVNLSGCQANGPGGSPGTVAVNTVTIALYRGSTFVSSIQHACGTYNFGRQGTAGTFHFVITEINGYTTAGAHVFLDASSVTVNY